MNASERTDTVGDEWATLSRALRKAHGFSQQDWAATLDVSRKTVQRWEHGVGVPDDRIESNLVEFCADRRVFERAARGTASIGVTSLEELADLLVRSRGRSAGSRPAGLNTARHLVGRDREMAQLAALWSATRLVTITGPSGVGKTALAMAYATALPSATVIVRLESVTDPELVIAQICSALRARQHAGRGLRDTVVRSVAAQPTLLVLDNFEQVRAAAPVVADLLASCPALRVLVTSRAPLRITAEVTLELAPLPADGRRSAAALLFVEHARVADPGADLTGAALDDIAQICARLDGLPLAIELAAARLRMMTLTDLRRRIDAPIGVLGAAPADRAAHQRTIQATLRWSYELLSPTEQRLFAQLAWFSGGFTLDIAEALAPATAVDDVSALVDHSLVHRNGPRYRMLELVRLHARSLPGGGDAAPMSRWAAAFIVPRSAELRGPRQVEALHEIDSEYENLRSALEYALGSADGELAGRLASGLAPYWDAQAMFSEARRWLELAAAAPTPNPIGRSIVVTWNAYFAGHQQDLAVADRCGREALAVWLEHGIDAGEGYARMVLGWVAAERHQLDEATTEFAASARLLRASGDMWGLVRPLNNLGEVARTRGDLAEAAACCGEALELCRSLGDEHSLPSILCNVAHIALDRGDHAAGSTAALEALDIAEGIDNGVARANALDALARAGLEAGDVEDAVRRWASADRLREMIGVPIEARDRQIYSENLERARARLGESRFDQLWAEGSPSGANSG